MGGSEGTGEGALVDFSPLTQSLFCVTNAFRNWEMDGKISSLPFETYVQINTIILMALKLVWAYSFKTATNPVSLAFLFAWLFLVSLTSDEALRFHMFTFYMVMS